jgi:glycosyltransferase involved in cell wall biosynthesis
VCQAQRRYWQRRAMWARRSEVIYNGVDSRYWRPRPAEERARVRTALGFDARELVVGLCGLLRPEKNHVQLVEAIAGLRARGLPGRALLIGDGETRPAVEARARAAGVSEHVIITGLQSDVRPLLGACDIVVLCSLTETFSIAALEAMALGRPVVHSDIGGAAEMIRSAENGFLFPVGDTPALIARLAALGSAEARARMGAAARATVEARFGERAMVDRYEALLLDLESTRRTRGNLRKSASAH